MKSLIICRHGESLWNLKNKFTGWIDVPLTEKGIKEAKKCGDTLLKEGYEFDIAYTSFLDRANKTLSICLKKMNLCKLKIVKDWRLNERHYGSLQGLNKLDVVKKFGDKKVKEWRRSFLTPPPKLDSNHKTHPMYDQKYKKINKAMLPSSESLKDVIERVMPLWKKDILNDIKDDKKILIVAHGNSLRALYKIIFNMSDKDIINFNIPTGIPMVIEFDRGINPSNSFYLGNKEEIARKIDNVKNQTTITK